MHCNHVNPTQPPFQIIDQQDLHCLLLQGSLKELSHTNSDFLIPISLQPEVVDPRHFKQ